MKNLKKVVASLSLILFSLSMVQAQEVAMVDLDQPRKTKMSTTKAAVVKTEQATIRQIADYLKTNLDVPVRGAEYANIIRVKIQFTVDKEGRILNGKVIEGQKGVGSDILATLSQIGKVEPVQENGRPVAQVIQLPLVFEGY